MQVHYKITPTSLGGHRFAVELTIAEASPTGYRLSLPTWIPGSYLVRDFAKHLGKVTATSGNDSVRVVKKDKSAWQLEATHSSVTVSYEVYAHDLSVRGAHLDSTHGFFNGSSVFLCVDALKDQAVSVEICPPDDNQSLAWRVATTLPRTDASPWGFGHFEAQDYDELIDHPVEMGDFDTVEFDVAGTPHFFVLSGKHQCSLRRLAADAQLICQQQVALFDELPSMERYLFLTRVEGQGYGGLEHRSSTALVCSRHMLPQSDEVMNKDYCQFLGLVSHEYFHLWNVKRIKPAVFSPYDLRGESYTELLWVFEGITSYYDDMALLRSGVIDEARYFSLLAQIISRVRAGFGHTQQSLADSSYDAWIKFYKPDENTVNSVVSYYAKGALLALALDLTVRQRTSDSCSLDQIMQTMWQTYGAPQVGVPEDGFEEVAEQVTGVHLRPFFESMVRDVVALPLEDLMANVGLVLAPATPPDANKVGKTSLGIDLKPNSCAIKTVVRNSCAEAAGLAASDVLVAINGLKVSNGKLSRLLRPYNVGDVVTVHAFRCDELLEFEVALEAPRITKYSLQISDDESDSLRRRRRRWLRGETKTA